MRLLHTTTFQIEEFFGNIPAYAILSHTWDERELTFQDLQRANFRDLPGFSKIHGCCERAREDGHAYVWIDTCCIDKTSSAELSEAINSMFQWYSQAKICYTYLSDVTGGWQGVQQNEERFISARWFTRGWTLQELLAPYHLVFYDSTWELIGFRDFRSGIGYRWSILKPDTGDLEPLIKKATGIQDFQNYRNASVARKMSWAASRSTTREEDRAYSLMGLFGVNMPPLYGEGSRAFYRLQLEILKDSDDETIFAWADGNISHGGIIALSVSAFASSGDIQRADVSSSKVLSGITPLDRPPFSMTNKGMNLSGAALSLGKFRRSNWDGYTEVVVLPISCTIKVDVGRRFVCLYLMRIRAGANQWTRLFSEKIMHLDGKQTVAWNLTQDNISSFYIRQLDKTTLSLPNPVQVVLDTTQITPHKLWLLRHHVQFDDDDKHLSWAERTPTGMQVSVQPINISKFAVCFTFENNDSSRFVSLLLRSMSHDAACILFLGPFSAETYKALHKNDGNIDLNVFRDTITSAKVSRSAQCTEPMSGVILHASLHNLRNSFSRSVYGFHIELSVTSECSPSRIGGPSDGTT